MSFGQGALSSALLLRLFHFFVYYNPIFLFHKCDDYYDCVESPLKVPRADCLPILRWGLFHI